MRTFGEFFDAIFLWTTETSNIEVKMFLEEWTRLVSPERWQECRNREFKEGYFFPFAEDMATCFQKRLQGICTDALYHSTMTAGHEFLKEIAKKGKEFGLDIKDEEVNVPLSPSDAIGMVQAKKQTIHRESVIYTRLRR